MKGVYVESQERTWTVATERHDNAQRCS